MSAAAAARLKTETRLFLFPILETDMRFRFLWPSKFDYTYFFLLFNLTNLYSH
jgi:hypothetical protein